MAMLALRTLLALGVVLGGLSLAGLAQTQPPRPPAATLGGLGR